MAACSALIINSPAQVTTNWFPKKHRAIATTIACMTNSFGVLIGFSLPSWFIDEYNDSVVLTD